MLIVLQYTWPLIVVLIGGFIFGILFVKIFIQKMRVLQKISLSGLLVVALVIGVVGGIGIISYGNNLAKSIFQREVRVVKDIDLEKDYYLDKDSGKVKGVIKAGSLGTQTFAKGGAVYLIFGTVVDNKYVETVQEQTSYLGTPYQSQ